MLTNHCRPLNGQELRAALLTLDLDQGDFADLLGITSSTVDRWMAGRSTVPGYVQFALRAWHAMPPERREQLRLWPYWSRVERAAMLEAMSEPERAHAVMDSVLCGLDDD